MTQFFKPKFVQLFLIEATRFSLQKTCTWRLVDINKSVQSNHPSLRF